MIDKYLKSSHNLQYVSGAYKYMYLCVGQGNSKQHLRHNRATLLTPFILLYFLKSLWPLGGSSFSFQKKKNLKTKMGVIIVT